MRQNIVINRQKRLPLYIQIRDQIKDLILNQALPEGTRLPTSRELAKILGISRGTVVSAYEELQADGFIDSHIGRGTFVSKRGVVQENFINGLQIDWGEFFCDDRYSPGKQREKEFDLIFDEEDLISFGFSIPDPKYYPYEDFREIIIRLLKKNKELIFLPAPPEGCYPLRQMIAEWMTGMGKVTRAEDVLITSGATQGLYLVAKNLVSSNDIVITENPTAFSAIRIFLNVGAQLVGIPVDEQGMRVDILDSFLSRKRAKLIYTIPTFQNPSGAVLSIERRKRLLEVAYKYRIPIIEDDPYRLLYFEALPPLPLKALDTKGIVIYLGTFSKIFFPGWRIGWVIAPREVINRLSFIRKTVDLYSIALFQYAFYYFCSGETFERYLGKIRKLYANKRDGLLASLSRHCSAAMTCEPPGGGFHLWCKLNNNLSSRELLKIALREKVFFIDGASFSTGGELDDWLRLSFSLLDKDSIEVGVSRLRRALQKLSDKKSGKLKEALPTKVII